VIDEGPRYVVRNVSLIGNEHFTNEVLDQKLELKSGEYFNQARMNRDVLSLRDTYGSEGFIFADIQADPRFLEEPGELDLVYRVKEGEPWRVGTINVKISGDYPHTRHSAVLNRISLRPGDLFDIREVRRSEQRLKASQLFEVDPSKGAPPQLAVIPPDLKNLEDSPITRPASTPRKGSALRGQDPGPR
jgi:outer membrane protein insertion porin family